MRGLRERPAGGAPAGFREEECEDDEGTARLADGSGYELTAGRAGKPCAVCEVPGTEAAAGILGGYMDGAWA